MTHFLVHPHILLKSCQYVTMNLQMNHSNLNGRDRLAPIELDQEDQAPEVSLENEEMLPTNLSDNNPSPGGPVKYNVARIYDTLVQNPPRTIGEREARLKSISNCISDLDDELNDTIHTLIQNAVKDGLENHVNSVSVSTHRALSEALKAREPALEKSVRDTVARAVKVAFQEKTPVKPSETPLDTHISSGTPGSMSSQQDPIKNDAGVGKLTPKDNRGYLRCRHVNKGGCPHKTAPEDFVNYDKTLSRL